MGNSESGDPGGRELPWIWQWAVPCVCLDILKGIWQWKEIVWTKRYGSLIPDLWIESQRKLQVTRKETDINLLWKCSFYCWIMIKWSEYILVIDRNWLDLARRNHKTRSIWLTRDQSMILEVRFIWFWS